MKNECVEGVPTVKESRYRLRKGELAIESEVNDSMWVWLDSMRKGRGVFSRGRIERIDYTNHAPADTGRVFKWRTGEDFGTPLDLMLKHNCLTLHSGMFKDTK